MSSEKKLVSAIIITHNRLKQLKKAVESVLNQDYPYMELIIVDDASEDGTEQYGESLSDSKVYYVRLLEHKGGNYARNVGIKKSRGKYIAFLDDDDYWYRNKISSQIDYFCKHPEIGILHTGFTVDYGKCFLKYNKIPNRSYQGDIIEKQKYAHPFCCTVTLMIRKDLLNLCGGFDENVHYWQEYELMLQLIRKTKVGLIEQPLVLVSRNLNDTKRLTNQFSEWIESVDYIHQKHNDLFEMLSIENKKKMLGYYYKEAAYRASMINDKILSKKFYIQAYCQSHSLECLIRGIFGISKKNTLLFEVLFMKLQYFCKYRGL
ncbi:MAG: glycosyltransferase [Lachnospiraceae bacterium]|nr:glycosyltransferase [Lachnospiraceae bacterium]